MKEVYNDKGLLTELEGSSVTLVDEEKCIYKVEKPFIVNVSDWIDDKTNYGFSALTKNTGDGVYIIFVTNKLEQFDLFNWSCECLKEWRDYGCISCVYNDWSAGGFMF